MACAAARRDYCGLSDAAHCALRLATRAFGPILRLDEWPDCGLVRSFGWCSEHYLVDTATVLQLVSTYTSPLPLGMLGAFGFQHTASSCWTPWWEGGEGKSKLFAMLFMNTSKQPLSRSASSPDDFRTPSVPPSGSTFIATLEPFQAHGCATGTQISFASGWWVEL